LKYAELDITFIGIEAAGDRESRDFFRGTISFPGKGKPQINRTEQREIDRIEEKLRGMPNWKGILKKRR